MRVTLLGNYPNDEHESMRNYAAMLNDLLTRAGCRVEIIRPEPVLGRLKRSGQGIGKWLGYVDKFLLFPFALRRHVREQKKAGKGDFLIHVCDHSNAMYIHWLRDVPHLVTCHDVLAIRSARGLIPGQKTGWTGRVLQAWILSGLRRAHQVVCVSEETRGELLQLAPELESRATTVENALPHPYAPMPPEEALGYLSRLGLDSALKPGGRGRFLLHVGGNQWYKNREGVIRIFAGLRASFPDLIQDGFPRLVLIGKPPTETMRRMVGEKKLTGEIFFVTAVSEEQLCAFYSLADALVFPSLQEGFGWPVLEAQACGCPVITSNRAPMNRLAGPAALLADPGNPADFSARIHELLMEQPELRRRRQAEALRHAGKYDGQVFLQEILFIYKKGIFEDSLTL